MGMKAKITPDEVKHIGELANLKIATKDLEKYASDLSEVISYVSRVQKADVKGVLPTKDRLEELVGGKRVKLSEIFRGSHERSIALVHVGDKLINEVMAREGYGRVTSTYTTQAKHLREEGDIARQGKIGLYSEVCSQKVTPDPKCAIKVNINQAGSSKDLYVSWVWCILRHYCAARY